MVWQRLKKEEKERKLLDGAIEIMQIGDSEEGKRA